MDWLLDNGNGILGLAGVVVGVVLGYWAARIAKSRDDHQQARGLLTAIRADVIRGTACFEEYARLRRGEPAWRLPSSTWRAALPFLAGMRVLEPSEIDAVSAFFDLAEELNHCFDRIATTDQSFRKAEENRAIHKAERAVKSGQGEIERLPERALSAIESAITRVG